jgi:hypothetical protein
VTTKIVTLQKLISQNNTAFTALIIENNNIIMKSACQLILITAKLIAREVGLRLVYTIIVCVTLGVL